MRFDGVRGFVRADKTAKQLRATLAKHDTGHTRPWPNTTQAKHDAGKTRPLAKQTAASVIDNARINAHRLDAQGLDAQAFDAVPNLMPRCR